MSKEENMGQVPKSNDTPEDVNENASQEQTIEPSTSNLEPQTQNMEVHHHPDLHHRKKHFNHVKVNEDSART